MKHSFRHAVAVAALCAGLVPTFASAELPVRHALPLSVAQTMVNACIDLAMKNKWAMTIVVKDAGDDLLAVARMDGAGLGTIDAATGKATAAGRFGAPTSAMANFAFDPKTKAPTALALIPGFVVLGGGLPIVMASGERIGAIATSGASPQQDEQCAQAGIDAVKDELK